MTDDLASAAVARYRQVLAVPGMAPLLGISLLARVAITSVVVALTMYVVLGLDLSYTAAGGVAAALTVGIALGAPLLGWMIDRWGLRGVLPATVVSQIVFWLSVPPRHRSYGSSEADQPRPCVGIACGGTVITCGWPMALKVATADSSMWPP